MVSLTNLNGGSDLFALRDSQVANLIKERVTKNTFGEINVTTVSYTFEGEINPIKTRRITLSRAETSVVLESIRAFIMAIFGDPKKERERYESSINLALVKEKLVGELENDEEESKQAEEEMRLIFFRCKKIHLYISNDCNFAEIKTEQSQLFIQARRSGQIVSWFIRRK